MSDVRRMPACPAAPAGTISGAILPAPYSGDVAMANDAAVSRLATSLEKARALHIDLRIEAPAVPVSVPPPAPAAAPAATSRRASQQSYEAKRNATRRAARIKAANAAKKAAPTKPAPIAKRARKISGDGGQPQKPVEASTETSNGADEPWMSAAKAAHSVPPRVDVDSSVQE
jgi:hypothetical protein